MYGLLLEGIFYYVKLKYGEELWDQVIALSGLPLSTFNTHKVYKEEYIPMLAEATAELTGLTVPEVMEDIGISFVVFVSQYGYDGVLKVLGRHLRDFLNGLDNLHEYLRFSYPKLRPPSFFCVNESRTGLTLHYRSRRRNFVHYVKGQIMQVAKLFYHVDLDIEIVSEFVQESMVNVILRLHFVNSAYKTFVQLQAERLVDALPVPSDVFFEVFPFNIVFNRGMKIRYIGDGLKAVMPRVIGHTINDLFDLTRPLVTFTWESVMMHTNNVFEIVTKLEVKDLQIYLNKFVSSDVDKKKLKRPNRREDVELAFSKMNLIKANQKSDQATSEKHRGRQLNLLKKRSSHKLILDEEKECELKNGADAVNVEDGDKSNTETDDETLTKCLKLKGQMMYMNDWDNIIFLGCPVMKDITDMFNAGLYINDLSMHDSSRDLILAGTQQSAELKLALDQEQQKSKKLEEFMKRLHVEMKRTDQLLYQMIPRSVADRLRRGEDPVETCETFECVTVLFSDVVGFTNICSKITPLQVVTMLNSMYTKFDQLSEKHKVYKVETIGDAYMVAAGAPIITKFHACYMCDMGLDMIATMWELKDPSSGNHITIRVGAHSGTVVAGVVGLKMPRYCLFGDAVNTASRMETNSEAQKIHISETTKNLLDGFPYTVKERGTLEVKGKGTMKTFWLEGKSELNPDDPKTKAMLEEQQRLRDNVSDSQSNLSFIDGETGSMIFNANDLLTTPQKKRKAGLGSSLLAPSNPEVTTNKNKLNFSRSSLCVSQTVSVQSGSLASNDWYLQNVEEPTLVKQKTSSSSTSSVKPEKSEMESMEKLVMEVYKQETQSVIGAGYSIATTDVAKVNETTNYATLNSENDLSNHNRDSISKEAQPLSNADLGIQESGSLTDTGCGAFFRDSSRRSRTCTMF